jgi:hypothetical protein
MKPSIKICEGCNHPKPLWSAKFKLCRDCYYKLNPQTFKPRNKIKPVSDKRQKELVLYRRERDVFMAQNKYCQAKVSKSCTVKSTDLHHRQGRTANLRNQDTWLSVCRNCHDHIHNNLPMDEAVKLGLMQTRN